MKKLIAILLAAILLGGLAAAQTPQPMRIQNGAKLDSAMKLHSGGALGIIEPVSDKGGQVFNVQAYGAKGDYTTDNTTAIQNALNAAATSGGGIVYFPRGTYKITQTLLPLSNVMIQGAGKDVSIIKTTCDTVFRFAGFTTTPATLWSGGLGGIVIRDIGLFDSLQWAFNHTGTRNGIGVMDNGNGGLLIENVRVRGFKYGFAGPYGSDFTAILNSEFQENDVGVYFGIGSQQLQIHGTNFAVNQESIVIENVAQGSIADCWFQDEKTSAITIEYDTTTRFGLNGNYGGSAGSGQV